MDKRYQVFVSSLQSLNLSGQVLICSEHTAEIYERADYLNARADRDGASEDVGQHHRALLVKT